MTDIEKGNLASVADSFRTAAGLPEKAAHIDENPDPVELAEVPDYGDPAREDHPSAGDQPSADDLAPKPEDGVGNMASDSTFGLTDENADKQIPGPTPEKVTKPAKKAAAKKTAAKK